MSRLVIAPDGLEAAAVSKALRDTALMLTVYGVDTQARTIELGNIRGDTVRYRWRKR